ncbi:glycosyltransferase [Bacteroidota bacterium]
MQEESHNEKNQSEKICSIILPTYNRYSDLKKCLKHLELQAGKNDEIIVVDDGSTDKTPAIPKEFKKVRYFRQKNKGPAAARNLGIKKAKGKIIVFTDDDCIPHKDWLRNIEKAHKNRKHLMIGGLTLPAEKYATSFVTQYLTNQSLTQNINGKNKLIYAPTCNVSFKKEVFNRFLFNENFPIPGGEDLEFGWKLFQNNVEMSQDKNIIVYHNINPSLQSFMKRNYYYGRGNLLTKKIFPDHVLLRNIYTKNFPGFLLFNIRNFLKTPFFGLSWAKKIKNSKKSNIGFLKLAYYFSMHNFFYSAGNFREFFRKIEVQKPKFLIIDSTHKCNLRCEMCDIVYDDKKTLSTNDVKRVITEGLEWGIENIVLSGGESLIRKDFFEIMDFVREKKGHVGLLTNGIFNENIFDKLKDYMINNNLSLTISFDSTQAEIHDGLRGKGSFEKTMNTLKRLKELKKIYPNINYGIISIIFDKNIKDLPKIVKTSEKFNALSVQFQPLLANNLIMHSRKITDLWVRKDNLELLDKKIDELIELKKEKNIISNSTKELELVKKYFRHKLSPKDITCLAATKSLLVSNDGNLTACKSAYGTIKKGLKKSWYSKKADKSRRIALGCKEPCLLPCFIEPR